MKLAKDEKTILNYFLAKFSWENDDILKVLKLKFN